MIINMKIKTFVTISAVAVALVSCGNSPETKQNEKKYSYQLCELNCPVQSLEQRVYNAYGSYGDVVKGDLLAEGFIAEFNQVGNVVIIVQYDENWNPKQVVTSKYDEDDNLIEEIARSNDGKQISRVAKEYNDEGELIKWTEYNENDEVKSYSTKEYEGGYQVKSTTVGEVETVKQCKRDGEIILEHSTYEDGKLVEVVQYSKYDPKGVVEYVVYDPYGVKTKEFYARYNDKEETVEKRSHDFGTGRDYEYKAERNDKGHIIHSYTSNNGSEYEGYYEYEYDSKGNWIKRIEYWLNGKAKHPVTIVERAIKY